jgi:GTP cyclohydrolase I
MIRWFLQFKQNFARVAEAARPDGHQDGTQRGVDLDAAERAAADFLTALGIDIDREERRATPARMARAYAELLAVRPFRLTTFPNDEGYDELVLARAIPFRTPVRAPHAAVLRRRARAEFFALARVPTPPGPM